jgi:phosphohistidine phosphatase
MDNDQVIQSNFSPKFLYLLRHSDAENNSADGKDFSRKLSQFGKQKAREFSSKYSSELRVDLVLCSLANRTRETVNLIDLKITEVLLYNSLYLAEKELILSEIEKTSNNVNKLLVVGHNNGLSDLASYLTGKNLLLSTCEMVEIQIETTEWTLIGQETGVLIRYFN